MEPTTTQTTHTDDLRATAEDFARRVRAALGVRVDAIVLCGSVAMKKAGLESDVDMPVVGSSDDDIVKAVSRVKSDQAREIGYRFFVETTTYDREDVVAAVEDAGEFVRTVREMLIN